MGHLSAKDQFKNQARLNSNDSNITTATGVTFSL